MTRNTERDNDEAPSLLRELGMNFGLSVASGLLRTLSGKWREIGCPQRGHDE